MPFELILQMTVNGLMMGAMLVTVALGLSLVFGVLRIVNLAHGEIYMLGGMLMWALSGPLQLPYSLSMILSILAIGIFGVILEKTVFKSFHSDMIGAVLISVGLILVLQAGALLIFGIEDKGIAVPENLKGIINFLGMPFAKQRLFAIFIGTIFVVLLMLFLKYSKMGQAIRAVAANPDVASLQGINISLISSLTMGIGCALAAGAGCLAGTVFQVNAHMGGLPLLEAMAVIILGGMGSIPGTIVGGIIIGLVKSFSSTLFSGNIAIMIIFLFIVIILIFKPSGLFGYDEKKL